MNLRQYYLRNVNISHSVQKDAEHLIDKMKNNYIEMETLPNSYENFTGELELEDFLSFCQFLESRKGKTILELVDVNL